MPEKDPALWAVIRSAISTLSAATKGAIGFLGVNAIRQKVLLIDRKID